jgi:pimeloyl-ACP methyl ester carboxylesterase
MEKRIAFRSSDGFKLAGILTLPAKLSGFAMLMHGITVDKDEWEGFYRDMATILCSSGIATLRFDFRGHGESSGTSLDVSVIGDILDMKAAMGQIRKYWSGRISLIGTSFGAGPTLLCAVQWSEKISRIVLIAPAIDYQASFLQPQTPWAKDNFSAAALDAAERRGYLVLDGTFRLSSRLIEEFRVIHPFDVIKKLEVPILIVHGDKDTMAPYSVSLAASRTFPNVRLFTLVNADHGYPDYGDETGRSGKSKQNKMKLLNVTREFLAGEGDNGKSATA